MEICLAYCNQFPKVELEAFAGLGLEHVRVYAQAIKNGGQEESEDESEEGSEGGFEDDFEDDSRDSESLDGNIDEEEKGCRKQCLKSRFIAADIETWLKKDSGRRSETE